MRRNINSGATPDDNRHCALAHCPVRRTAVDLLEVGDHGCVTDRDEPLHSFSNLIMPI